MQTDLIGAVEGDTYCRIKDRHLTDSPIWKTIFQFSQASCIPFTLDPHQPTTHKPYKVAPITNNQGSHQTVGHLIIGQDTNSYTYQRFGFG